MYLILMLFLLFISLVIYIELQNILLLSFGLFLVCLNEEGRLVNGNSHADKGCFPSLNNSNLEQNTYRNKNLYLVDDLN